MKGKTNPGQVGTEEKEDFSKVLTEVSSQNAPRMFHRLIVQIRFTGEPITITRFGRAVARLVPWEP